MSKYIDADELKRSYAPLEGCLDVRTLDGAKKIFDAFVDVMPAADVVEVRHGKWAEIEDRTGWSKNFFCSECRHEFFVDTCMLKPMWNYCPNCGASMRGEEE